jgi:hypothetical protein
MGSEMDANEDPYKTLGIAPDATIEEIKCAYRKAVIRWHPDVSKTDPAESERRFRLVTEAYKHTLRDALLASRKAREASQARAASGEPVRCGPHGDRRRYTPPEPSSRQRKCQIRPGYRRQQAFRHIWRGIQTTLAAILCFVWLACILVPAITQWNRMANMDPEERDRYMMEQPDRERRKAELEANREFRERNYDKRDREAAAKRRRIDDLLTAVYLLLVFGLPPLAWLRFRHIIRQEKP